MPIHATAEAPYPSKRVRVFHHRITYIATRSHFLRLLVSASSSVKLAVFRACFISGACCRIVLSITGRSARAADYALVFPSMSVTSCNFCKAWSGNGHHANPLELPTRRKPRARSNLSAISPDCRLIAVGHMTSARRADNGDHMQRLPDDLKTQLCAECSASPLTLNIKLFDVKSLPAPALRLTHHCPS